MNHPHVTTEKMELRPTVTVARHSRQDISLTSAMRTGRAVRMEGEGVSYFQVGRRRYWGRTARFDLIATQ